MNLIRRGLLLILCLELLGGGVFLARRLMRFTPPVADWSFTSPSIAEDIRKAIVTCESAEDWRKLGELYMAAGYFAESEMCHRVACERDPRNAQLHRQWGFALERVGLLAEANLRYLRSMELAPGTSGACRYLIGRNLLRTEKPDAARVIFEAGQVLPANQYELARLHLRAGNLAEATTLLNKLVTYDPMLLQVNQLGYRLALEREDVVNSLRFADRVRYSPRKLQTPFDEEAERLVKTTQQLGPGRLWTTIAQLLESNALEEAKALLESQAETDRNMGFLELSAEIALRQQHFEIAVQLLEELQQRFGPFARITARIGDVYDAAGEFEKACDFWRKATQLQAGVDLKAVHHKLADSLTKRGKDADARQHRKKGHYFVGRELLQFGYAEQAVNYLQEAVEIDPSFTQAWFYLGEAKRLGGQRDEARAAYQKCLEQNPVHGRALTSLSLLQKN